MPTVPLKCVWFLIWNQSRSQPLTIVVKIISKNRLYTFLFIQRYLKNVHLHFEIKIYDWNMRENGICQHFPRILCRRLFWASEIFLLLHFGGNKLERLLLGEYSGTVTLLWTVHYHYNYYYLRKCLARP